MIFHLVENATLLLSLCWLQLLNTRFWGNNDSAAKLTSGLLFGFTCVIGIMMAREPESGLIFDARSVVLSMAALFGGPLVAGVAGLLAGGYRLWLGGAGMWPGVAEIVLSVLLGLAYRYVHRGGKVGTGPWSLLIFGLLTRTLLEGTFFLFPLASVDFKTSVPMLLVMPLATVGLGWMLGDIIRRVRDERDLNIAATAFETRQGLLVTDPNSRILRVNQAFSAITGYSPDEVIGKQASLLSSGRHNAVFYQAMWRQLSATGRWQGEVWNRRKSGELYPEWLSISAVHDPRGQVSHYVAAMDDITERKAAEARIQHLAFFDALTGLPNRSLLLDRVQHAMNTGTRSNTYTALLFLDVDGFKSINDLHGHHIGDQLLRLVAERLGDAVRSSDTVARLGADAFVVMIEDLDREHQHAATQAELRAKELWSALGKPYRIDELTVHSSVSMGVTLFSDDASTAGERIQQAEMAMYQAKAAGRRVIRFFDSAMQEAVSTRLLLEEDIRRGLQAEEFIPYLQPQLNEAGRVIGAEVLARWQHPQRGLLAPGVFIEVAEQAGLVEQIDLQMLRRACYRLSWWRQWPATASLGLAVNLSARLLYQADFVDTLLRLLARSGADPHQLKLELTETMLLDDMPAAIARMRELKGHGIRFSIDDFGTGYSSLAYLQKLPLDQLKIDQSFVRELPEDGNSLAIINAICALAGSLQLEVIAEGVETEAQHRQLRDMGCRYFQGYLFGRPMPVGEFERLLVATESDNAVVETISLERDAEAC
ncbi:diguanylate cyclase (GGDEF)-like protein/PAS domain S-box-containing protein [Oceanisphaera litoralis]|uniref:putative bifunctional diguanylate cyclase/phosphodiesterase n=1 Tax=Oceanisphaera litoralis TaxID=225144 RepID=UPI0019582DA6|nr:EAL domain-containing protein [Oceanisphaera litoralis]MBM7456837.1 diguanylate cyclase (GGDEF)-like protein/PAS domain S-box-containing protein [Oceanisphaera litoralis]